MGNKKIIIKINPKKRMGHIPHRSGSGTMDNRPKRLRTRNSQNINWKKENE